MDLERVKDINRIEEVIRETAGFGLRGGQGAYLKAVEHDSLVIDVRKQLYNWNSRGHHGDVINWLQNTQKMDFRQAVEFLCRRAGLPFDFSDQDAKAWAVARERSDKLTTIAKYLHGLLLRSAAATEYARGRGWSDELLADHQVGYWDGNRKALQDHLRMHQMETTDPVVEAILRMPPDMLVYAHFVGAKCQYLSGRGISEKRHWNLPKSLVGPRQPFYNTTYNFRVSHVVVVEGQADALTLAGWGVAAVALTGVEPDELLLRRLGEHQYVYVGLDADEAGLRGVDRIARELGPLTRILIWPAGDANDWHREGATSTDVRQLMANAPIHALYLARRAGEMDKLNQDEARRAAVEVIARLPEYSYLEHRKDLARALDLNLGQLDGMVKAVRKDQEKSEKAEAYKVDICTPNGLLDGHLFETLYQEDEDGPRTLFAVRYPDGRISTARMLTTDNYRVTPPDPFNSLLKAKVIRLASDVGAYGSEVELQQEIQEFIHKYVDVPDHIERLASYYVMMTWLYDAFYVLPYLRARGDSDSGKSRFTEVVGELCMRSIFVTGSTTPSPVFRSMEKWNGLTVVMDEADLPHSETSADWIQMLNTGYKRGFHILRTAIANGEASIEAFNAFGPKIINMRGRFLDDATESRCLTWETSSGRGIRADIPRYMDREGFLQEAQALRNKLLRYRLQTFQQIEVDYNHEATKHMPGRLVEITVPLMSITTSDEFKKSVMGFIRDMNRRAIMQRQGTLAAKVLEGILRAYYLPDEKAERGHEGNQLSIGHITRQTNFIINRENLEAIADGDEEMLSGKRLVPKTVGKIVSDDLNLEKEPSTVGTKPMLLKWDNDRMAALITRYGLEQTMVDLMEVAEKRAAEKAAADDGEGEQDVLF